MSREPVVRNYDFHANWHKVLPVLKGSGAQEQLAKMYVKLSPKGMSPEHRRREMSPAMAMTRSDGAFMRMEAVKEYFLENRDETGLDSCAWADYDRILSKEMAEANDDEEDCDELFHEEDRIMDMLGFDWRTNKDKMIHYFPGGCCHDFNPAISLYVAERVEPSCKWNIISSDCHTTVYCEERNQVFDMVAYGWGNNLYKISIGKQPVADDDGGDEGYRMAVDKRR